MNLSFSTKWPKQMPPHMRDMPTNFAPRILSGLYSHKIIDQKKFSALVDKYVNNEGRIRSMAPGKIHTIRRDQHRKWRPGMKIHFGINLRTPDYMRFAPVVICKSIQAIEIQCPTDTHSGYIEIDGKALCSSKMQELAINDGFDSLDDFWSWFKQDPAGWFYGKLIHWTDLKY